jgi:hypothetical protein
MKRLSCLLEVHEGILFSRCGVSSWGVKVIMASVGYCRLTVSAT